MITPRSLLSKQTHNATRKFSGLLTKPHLRNLREMQIGMILGKSSQLSTIGDSVSEHVTPRKNSERYSRTLENIDSEECCKRHIECAALRFQDEPVLLLGDGGDFQKKHAKKMKQVCKTVDGSNGHSVGKGYPTFGIIAYGTETKKQLPLCHHLYSTVDPDFKSEWLEQEKCYEWCAPFIHGSPHDRIIVEDRGGDDEKRFIGFMEGIKCNFLTRINTGANSRNLCPVIGGEMQAPISVKNITRNLRKKSGSQKKWYNKKLERDLTSTITFREVRIPSRPDIPLFLVLLYTDGFDDPIAVLTDIDVHSHNGAWRIFFWYKKRWEVENFFRAIKQNFGAEKFLIRNFKAIRGLAFVQMLTFALLIQLKEYVEENEVFLFQWFQQFCNNWQRKNESHLDLLAWIRKVWHQMPEFPSHRSLSYHMTACLAPPPDQTSIFGLRKKW